MPRWRNFTNRRKLKWPERGEPGWRVATPMSRSQLERGCLIGYFRIGTSHLDDAIRSFAARDGRYGYIIREAIVSPESHRYNLQDYRQRDDDYESEVYSAEPFTAANLPEVWSE